MYLVLFYYCPVKIRTMNLGNLNRVFFDQNFVLPTVIVADCSELRNAFLRYIAWRTKADNGRLSESP